MAQKNIATEQKPKRGRPSRKVKAKETKVVEVRLGTARKPAKSAKNSASAKVSASETPQHQKRAKDTLVSGTKRKLKVSEQDVVKRTKRMGSSLVQEIEVQCSPGSASSLKAKSKRGVSKGSTLPTRVSKGRFVALPNKKGKKYAIDLRIHSPGTIGFFSTGGVEPGPAFVRLARIKGLDIMAVTDHNNADYIDVIKKDAHHTSLTVLPGVDLCAQINICSEVCLTALFPEHYTSLDVFGVIEALEIPRSARGRPNYCIRKPFKEVIEIVESREGILIPTRMDKNPYRQLAIPTLIEEFHFHAFDLIHPENTSFFKHRWPHGEFTFFCFSNANSLAQVGARIEKVRLTKPGFDGLKELIKRRCPEEQDSQSL